MNNHWMMFGTFSEQRYFTYPGKESYSGVILNANMVAHAPTGMSNFVLTKIANQRYIIDPQTHAFQHDIIHILSRTKEGDHQVKKSIGKLAEKYEGPIADNVGKNPILPEMFTDPSVRNKFVESCIAFQKNELCSRMEASDDSKYTSFESSENSTLRPYAVVAPYFYMTDSTVNEWLDLNIAFAKKAKKIEKECKVFASIVVNQSLIIDEAIRNNIIEKYKDIEIDGFLLWVDNLDESAAGKLELAGFLKLALGLLEGNGKEKREVINLHGGYFSILSTSPAWPRTALSGVCHGPEFGEFRSVVPVGGGIPIAKYYLPLVHQRMRYRDVASILIRKGWLKSAKEFYSNVCNCTECNAVVDNDPDRNFAIFGDSNAKLVKRGSGMVRMEYPTTKTKTHCLKHYLERKQKEHRQVTTMNKEKLIDDLKTSRKSLESVLGLEGVSHLKKWVEVLTEELK